MKRQCKVVSMLLVVVMLLSTLSALALPILAADTGAASGASTDTGGGKTDQKQKIVAMVYDNSGSMYDPKHQRSELAEYSAKILMSILDDNDKLYVVPMSEYIKKSNGDEARVPMDHALPVTLDDPKREDVVDDFFEQSQYFPPHSITNGAQTPITSVDVAIQHLVDDEDCQLPSADNQLDTDVSDKEFWLVILTDGAFTEYDNSINGDANARYTQVENINAKIETAIQQKLENYPDLKTLYVSLDLKNENAGMPNENGSPAKVAKKGLLTGRAIDNGTTFKAYDATSSNLVETIQDVANRICGRYTLPKTAKDSDGNTVTLYEVNDKTLTIHLNRLNFPIKSVAVLAQGTPAKLDSGELKCDGATPVDVRPCQIVLPLEKDPPKACFSMIQNQTSGGYTHFPNEGTLTIPYSGAIPESGLSIFVEPALSLDMVLYKDEGGTTEISESDISKLFGENDTVYVGYRVRNQATGDPVELSDIFDSVSGTLSYAGINSDISYKNNQPQLLPVKLTGGVNTMSMMITAKQGNAEYVLKDSIQCIIPATSSYKAVRNEGECHVEFDVVTNEANVSYTVTMDNGSPVSDDEWKALERSKAFYVAVTSPDGAKTETYELTANGKGKISGTVYAFDGPGAYTVSFFIGKTDMGVEHTVTAVPVDFTVDGGFSGKIDPSTLSATGIYTVIDGKGNAVSKADLETLYTYSATVALPGEDTPSELPVTLDGNGRLCVTVNAEKGHFGKYTVVLSVTSSITGETRATEPQEVFYYPSSITVTPSDGHTLFQYELDENKNASDPKKISFTVTAMSGGDVFDLPFDNGFTTWKLTVNGDTVASSEDALPAEITLDGNVMNILLSTAQLGNGAGEKKVALVIDYTNDDGNQKEASGDLKITVEKTIYVIKTFTDQRNVIDRFHLSETEATVYFYICRMDGDTAVPLNLDALKSRIVYQENNDGTFTTSGITVKDKKMGIFGLSILSPTGVRIAAPTTLPGQDGIGFIPVEAYRDMAKYVDSYIAMFVSTGDKPIILSYTEGASVGTITAETYFEYPMGAIGEYILRVVVTVIVIYLILYLVGFLPKFAIQMPKGRYVVVRPAAGSTKRRFNHNYCNINLNFWDAFRWHLIRLIPGGSQIVYKQPWFWHQQPPKQFPLRGLELEHTKEGNFRFRVKGVTVYPMQFSNIGIAGQQIAEYRSNLAKGKSKVHLSLPSTQILANFQKASVTPVQQNAATSAKGIYGIYKRNGTLDRIIFFVQEH